MKKYELDTENLAVPEYRSEKNDKNNQEKPENTKSVDYDNLAFPEIHIKKNKKN